MCTHFNDIFDSSPASDSCFVTAVFAAPLDALGALENVLWRKRGVAEFDSARENAAANFPVRVAAFFDGFRTKANNSRITLRCSLRGSVGGASLAGSSLEDCLLTGTHMSVVVTSSDEEKSKTFSVMPQLSDGFDTVIGGTGNNVFSPMINNSMKNKIAFLSCSNRMQITLWKTDW